MPPLLTMLTIRRLLPWAFFFAGIGLALRYPSVNGAAGESGKAAITLLDLGFIGNPYLIPTGPTAHVSPLLTWILAAVYAVFGENSELSRICLSILASLLFALGIRAALRLCSADGLGRTPFLVAVALFLLLPPFLFQSVVYGRQWDQPFAAFFLVQGWLLFERSGTSAKPYRYETGMAFLAGLGGLLSPAIFPTLAALLAAMFWQRRKRGNYRISLILSVGIVAACLLPWGVRNQLVLGQFILFRSNFALELATGNAPGALGYSGSGSGTMLHPHDSAEAARQAARLGEVSYMRGLQRQSLDWIAADPKRFLRLSVERVKLSFFPLRPMIPWYPALGVDLPWILLTAFGVLRVVSLLCAIFVGAKPGLGYLCNLLPMFPYFVTHVNVRYCSTAYFTSVVMIGLVAGRIVHLASRPRAGAPSQSSSPIEQPPAAL